MKIIYLSYSRLEYALNSVTIKGLRKNGVEVIDFQAKKGIYGLGKAVSFYRHNSNADVVIVGYDSPGLVILLRFFPRKKIIYNAVLSVYQRLIVSRVLAPRFSLKSFYYWFLDFLAVHFAYRTFVESDLQADYFARIFKVSRKKVLRSWIGVDEDNFFYDPTINKFDKFTVLFRGALQPETGAEYVVQTAKLLEGEDIKFIMHVGGQLIGELKSLIRELKPNNLDISSELLPAEELRRVMQKCHVSLGQLSKHERLKRTIPHKAYESLAMKLPYLTAANPGILELLKDGETCITCKPADARSLADKILWLKNNYPAAEKIAENGYQLYQAELTSAILAKNLLSRINEF